MTMRLKILCGFFGLGLFLSACQPSGAAITPTSDATRPVATATITSGTPTATPMPEIDLDPALLNGAQIHFVHPWSGETAQALYLMAAEFNQSNEWGIQVILEETGSLGLALQELIERETDKPAIDLVVLPVSELLRLDLEKANIVDLNPYAASQTFGQDQIEKDFFPLFWNYNLIDGKLYGIPAQASASLLFYNATWATELGFSSVPTTTTEFRAQVCAANASFRNDNDRLNDGMGGWLISKDASVWLNWLKVFQAVESNAPIEQLSTLKTQAAFEYLFNLQKDACAWEGRLPEPYDYFATRQTLMYSGTPQDIAPQAAAFDRSGSQDQWQMILYPSGSDPKMLIEELSYGVMKTDEANQLASWLFIRWLSKPENQVRLLKPMGSFPLGTGARSGIADYQAASPKWGEATSLLPFGTALPPQSDEAIIRMVLADAGAYLLKPEFTIDQVPALLQDLDATVAELVEAQP